MKNKALMNRKTLIVACLVLILCWNVALMLQHPTNSEMLLVKQFVTDCKDQNCTNDWSVGWWVTASGGETQSRGGPPSPDYNSMSKPFRVLTSQTLFECKLYMNEGILNYYRCN